jgi:hypothetical protein
MNTYYNSDDPEDPKIIIDEDGEILYTSEEDNNSND